MAYTDNLLTNEQDDVLMMTPDKGGADFDDEGSGATSGYGDLTDDDELSGDANEEEPLEVDPDDDLQGDDLDEEDDI